MNEDELVARAREGDGAAWERLVHQHREPIFRLAYLFLGDAAEAEDVTQDAFVRAYRALDRFDRNRPLRPWLLSIGANLARNRRRALGRYLQALGRFLRATPEPILDGRQALVRNWEAETLWQAVRRLSVTDQEVIYLRYFLELPEGEAAEVLGIPKGTLKSRTHRALRRLREIVERDFPSLMEGYHDARAVN